MYRHILVVVYCGSGGGCGWDGIVVTDSGVALFARYHQNWLLLFLIWLISVDLEPISDGSFVALENTSLALEAAHA